MFCVLTFDITELGKNTKGAQGGGAWRQRNYREFLICYFPFPIYSIVLIYPVLYIVNPNLPVLLISFIESEARTILMTFLLVPIEIFFYLTSLLFCHYGMFLTLSFIVTFTQEMDTTLEEIWYELFANFNFIVLKKSRKIQKLTLFS